MKPAVSSLGRIRDCRGIVKTPCPKMDGYVTLNINHKTYSLHRLMAIAFLGDPPSTKHQVDHKDGNPRNNRVENLEWVTRQENIRRSFANNKKRKSNAFKQSKPVKACKVGTDEWIRFDSIKAAARALQLKHGSISNVTRKKINQTGGFKFMWDEPNEPAVLAGEEWRDIV